MGFVAIVWLWVSRGGPMMLIIISAAFGLSLASGIFLISIMPRLKVYARLRDDQRSVQCSHVGDPPRIGGLAIICGIAFGVALQILSAA